MKPDRVRFGLFAEVPAAENPADWVYMSELQQTRPKMASTLFCGSW
jgi:hypothetical protein